MTENLVPFDGLLNPPVSRAAYSDRTAWLMATLSNLAYTRFEEALPVENAIKDVTKLIAGSDFVPDKIKKISPKFTSEKLTAIIRNIADSNNRDQNKEKLVDSLNKLELSLVETFSVNIPFLADTQAFIAKLYEKDSDRKPFLVLVFRGTEPKKPTDLKSDLHAETHILGYLGGPGGSIFVPSDKPKITFQEKMYPPVKVHHGFWKAFEAVKDKIESVLNSSENRELPLYITGHSLGGALAVVATYALASDRIAACYTFGSPRVGNLRFGQRIKPPVYRVVNASDIVPRLPPGIIVDALTILLRALPAIPKSDKLADWLERFRGYRHYGDMRYLNDAEPHNNSSEGSDHFPKLVVLSNPSQVSRWYWLLQRWVATGGLAAVRDHNIETYQKKLAYWAHIRSGSMNNAEDK